jgi:hypothetical protein
VAVLLDGVFLALANGALAPESYVEWSAFARLFDWYVLASMDLSVRRESYRNSS